MSYVARPARRHAQQRALRNVVVGDFSADGRKAMTENPDYFLWWYSAKSIGLVVALAYIAFSLGQRTRNK